MSRSLKVPDAKQKRLPLFCSFALPFVIACTWKSSSS